MKKWGLVLGVVAVLAIAFGAYSYFVATNEIVADEASPLVKDSLDSMSQEEKQEFDDAVEEAEEDILEESDNMPESASVISMGDFHPRAHSVEGEALLIQDGDKKILRFENFETINGPNLHIYLASELGNDDFVDLGKIKATKGNVNYEIPEGTDTEKYNHVLVWCVPFRVLFSYAELE